MNEQQYDTVYQLLAKGDYLNFSGEGKIHSGIIYINEPTEKEIEIFKLKCCNSKPPQNLFDLNSENVKIEILKLKLQITDKI